MSSFQNLTKLHQSSFRLGSNSKFLHVFPFLFEGTVKGVGELATFAPLNPIHEEFLKLSLDTISIAFNSAQIRAQVSELLEKTQLQSEELQSQQEELRTTNEELEEQKQELETQSEELRQANEELEEQRSALEEQKEALQHKNYDVEQARSELQEKAEALEVASKYKSEFLANMSHELRTPLNSILLLSRALYENPSANLIPSQQESSKAIYSSGCDLLNLINDILDLSKVEAGKLDINIAEVDISEVAGTLHSLFGNHMTDKGLVLDIQVSRNCPKMIHTDRLRLEQILKNFLSNALKFTAAGSVKVVFSSLPGARVCIAVSDTGVGIPAAKRDLIFKAFERGQNGSIPAGKHGGTGGLGLTICERVGSSRSGRDNMARARRARG